MKQFFLIAALLVSVGLSAQNENTLRVEGKGELEVVPDLMKFNLNFNINADTQDESIKELNELMDQVIIELKKAGIHEDSIKTDNFRTNVVDNTYRNGKNYFTSSQQMYFIIGAKSEQIVTLLNVLSNVEGSFNFSPSPLLSKELREQKEKELAALAFQNAKEQAEILGSAGAFDLGKIKNIDFQSANLPVLMRDFEAGEAVFAYAEQKSFGNFNLAPQKLSKSVWVTYYIKQ